MAVSGGVAEAVVMAIVRNKRAGMGGIGGGATTTFPRAL